MAELLCVAFKAFKWRRCAECEVTIPVGEDMYAYDYHVFCSRDCIADYILWKEVM